MLKQHNWCSSILLPANVQDEDDRFNGLIVCWLLVAGCVLNCYMEDEVECILLHFNHFYIENYDLIYLCAECVYMYISIGILRMLSNRSLSRALEPLQHKQDKNQDEIDLYA